MYQRRKKKNGVKLYTHAHIDFIYSSAKFLLGTKIFGVWKPSYVELLTTAITHIEWFKLHESNILNCSTAYIFFSSLFLFYSIYFNFLPIYVSVAVSNGFSVR